MPETIVSAASEAVKCGFVYEAATDYAEAVERGKAAAMRILSGATLIDWFDVATMLDHGSRHAAMEAGQAKGRGYIQAYHRWLVQHPELEKVKGPERAAAIWALKPENRPAVDRYLKSLAPEEYAHMTMRKVKQKIGPPPKPRAPKPESELAKATRERDEMKDKWADAEERLAGAETDAMPDWSHYPIDKIAKSLARILNADRLDALIAALMAERAAFDRAA